MAALLENAATLPLFVDGFRSILYTNEAIKKSGFQQRGTIQVIPAERRILMLRLLAMGHQRELPADMVQLILPVCDCINKKKRAGKPRTNKKKTNSKSRPDCPASPSASAASVTSAASVEHEDGDDDRP